MMTKFDINDLKKADANSSFLVIDSEDPLLDDSKNVRSSFLVKNRKRTVKSTFGPFSMRRIKRSRSCHIHCG